MRSVNSSRRGARLSTSHHPVPSQEAAAKIREACRCTLEELESRTFFNALIFTDQSDYAPGSTALVTATSDGGPDHNFQAGETIAFHLDRTDGIPVSSPPAIQDWQVVDGGSGFSAYQDSNGMWIFPDDDGQVNGSVQTSWYVDPQFSGASLALSATGLTSGETALTNFTDAGNASDGDGANTVSPTSVTANSTGNNFTFQFRVSNPKPSFNSGSQATIVVPAGWTAPQTSGTVGLVNVTAVGGGAVSSFSTSGQTITVNFTTGNANDGFNVTYNNVTAPATVGSNTFTTKTKQAAGTLTNIGTQPTETVANAAPVLSNIEAGALSFTENGAATAITSTLQVSDANDANLASATVSISANYVNGQDVLGFTNQNGITGSFNAGTGVLTLSGSSSVTNYQTALRSVTYVNTSDNPSTNTRSVTFVANDGTTNSAGVTRNITITAVNDAPAVTTSGGTTSSTENLATAVDNALTVSDVDSANLTGATITISSNYVSGEDTLGFTNQLGITGSFNAGTGVLTLSGTTTVANYQTALRAVTYSDSSDNPSTLTRTISFQVTDGSLNSNTATKSVSVTAVNDAPVVSTSGGTTSYTENASPTVIDGGVTVADVDNANLASATVSITAGFSSAQDVLGFTNQNGITGSYNAGTGVLTLSGSATLANYQAALASVTYSNSSDNPSTTNRTISFQVNDGAANSNAATKTVSVAAVNDAPVVTTSGGASSYTENAAATAIDNALTVTDVDSANLSGATVSITGNYVNGQDVLGFTTQNGITGSFNAATGTMTLSGSATVANYQTALRTVTYSNSSDNPSTLARTISFQVTDSSAAASNVSTKTLNVTAVNDAPVVTTSGGTTAYTENAAATVVDGGVTVSDADNTTLASATVSISANFASGQDVLAATTGVTNITASYNAGTGVLTLTGSDTLANYQTVLRSVTYANTSENPSTANRTITFVANDGTANSAGANKTVSVAAVNDAPVVATSVTDLAYTENDPATAVDNAISVTDVDSANLTGATVTISSNYVNGQDVLAFTNQLGITGSFSAATGVLTLSGTTTVANYQTALRAVTYSNSSNNPSTLTRTVGFRVTDSSAANSNTATRNITVAAVNDAPTVTTSGGTTAYTENAAPILIDNGLTVADADNTNLAGATVSISGNFFNAEDSLAFTNQNGITGSYNSATGVLSLSGSATVVNYQTALRSITYSNSSDAPNTASRTISFVVNDGTVDSAAANKTVSVTAVNDAPVLGNTSPTLTSINEDDVTNTGIDVSTFIAGLSITDADTGAVKGIAVTSVDNTNGSWQFSTNSGGSWSVFGSPTAANSRLLSDASTNRIRFIPNANFNGAATFSFRAWDQTTGTNGNTASSAANGGTTAFSSAAGTTTLTINSVNDAPSGANKTITLNEDSTYTFTTADFGFSDVNDSPANNLLAVKITTLPGAGTLKDNGVAISANQFIPVADITANKLTFTPAPDGNGTPYSTFTFQVQDDGGTANGGVDLDASANTITLNVTAVNDAPTLNAISDPATILEDAGLQIVNLSGITAGDSEVQTLIVTATSNNTSLIPNPTVTYTSANTTGSLSYTPVANANGSAVITVTVTDNGGTANGGVNTFTRQFTVNVTAVNDAPVRTSAAPAAINVNEDSANTTAASLGLGALNYAAGPASATDETSTQSLTYTLTAVPSFINVFLADGTTQVAANSTHTLSQLQGLKYKTIADANGSGTLTWTMQDNGGVANGGADTLIESLSVTVNSVNDQPTLDVIPNPAAILEDAGLQTVNLSGITAGDSEVQTLTVTATSNNTALIPNPTVTYTSANSTGSLSYTPVANLSGSAIITVTVTDNGGTANGGVNSITRTFTVNVTAVNDAPTFTFNGNPNKTVAEDSGAQSMGNFINNVSAGPNETQNLTFSATNDNNALFSVQPVLSFQGNGNGKLDFTPAPNANGSATVTVTLSDDGGTANGGVNSSSQTFTITVTAVNDAPVVTVPGTQNTLEDTNTVISGVSVSDIDAGSSNITLTLGVINGTLNINNSVAGGISTGNIAGNGTNSVTLNGSQTAINATLADAAGLTYRGVQDFNGFDTLTVTANDNDNTGSGGALTNTKTVTINLAAVNDAPSFTEGSDQTVLEDAGAQTVANFATNISAGPADESGQTVNFIVSNDNNSIFLIQPTITANGSLSYTSAPNANGSAIVTVRAHDNGGVANGGVDTSLPQAFVINITPVNDTPSVSADQNSVEVNEGSTATMTGTYADVDVTDNVAISASIGSVIKTGTNNGTWSWSFDTNDGPTQGQTVTITANDNNGGVSTTTFALVVDNVAPTAAIVGAPATSPEGTQIHLTSTVTDPGTADTQTYSWSVTKNGNAYASGTNAGFSFTPDDNGSYVVSLTVTDDDGGVGSDSKTIAITNVNPTATIVGAPASSPEGTQIDLTSNVTDPGSADTFTYAWTVTKNGNAYSSGNNAGFSFTPDDNGSYVISLTVTDDDGGTSTDAKTIAVTNVAPTAAIVGTTASSPEGTQINLTSTVTDPGNADTQSYLWTVTKDGNAYDSGTNASFSFTPDDNASYVVTLTVTDDDSGQGVDTKTISVTNVAPTATINGAPASSPEGTQINLTSSVTDPGTADTQTYAWSVTKNGNAYASGTNAGFSFTPDDNGSYVVSLTVTDDDGGQGSDTKTIAITNVDPTATIVGAPASSPEGTQIDLTSNVTDPGSADTFTYAWTVTKNGNAYDNGTNAGFSFTPDDNGTFAVSLTVTDDDGGTSTDAKTITVTNVAPTAAIVGAPASSPEGTQIDLTSTVTDPGSADTQTYLWTVTKNGNAYSSGTSAGFSFTPDDNGSYVVNVTVTDDDGGVGSDAKTIAVTNVAPTATIVGAPASSPEGTAINLTSTVSDPGSADTQSYLWSVTKNGNAYDSGTAASFSFTPDDNGTYVVSLSVTDDDGGVGSDNTTIAVTNVAPTATITGAPASGPEGTQITLGSTVTDPGSADTFTYAWSVTKNGNAYAAGTNLTFSFTPNDDGAYVVSLAVTDDDGGVGNDSKSITITNVAPTADINGAPASSPEGTQISLTSTVTDPGSADTFTYAWSVTKDGNAYDSGTSSGFNFTPDDNGTYVVNLTVTDDDGGVGSDSKTIAVTNVDPTATINGAPASSPEGTQIDLTSTVTDAGSADTFTYAWSVTKNGNAYAGGTNAGFSFTPDDNGSYVVSLTVTDDDGGTSTDAKTITVTNVAPTAAINGAPSTSPEGTQIDLTSTVTDPGSADTFTYAWTVTKDGNAYGSATTTNFSFTPNDNASYIVTLTVTDDDGGVGTDTKTIAVTNVDPTATINGAPSTSPEGTQIDLTSSVSDPGSADTFTYAWSVTKNGSAYASGTSAGFSFTPDDNGSYVVSLTVTDDDGGVGSDSKTIAIANVDPTATINGAPASSPEGTQIDLASTVTDPGSADTFTYAWSVTKNGNAYASGTSASFSFTPDDNGSYVVSLTVTDDDGGVGFDAKSINATNVDPTATINGAPASSPEGTPINLTTSVTDPGTADTFTYAWSVTKNGNAYASSTNAGFSFTPDDNGTYVVSLTVTDDDGGQGSDTKTIAITNVDPTATIVGAPASSPEGTQIDLTSTVTDPGSADTFTYAWTVTKNGNAYDGGTDAGFSFTPDDNGTYAVSLTVTDDDGGTSTDAQTIAVTNVDPTATINGAPSSSPEGTQINLTSTVTDPGSADTFTYAWSVTKNGNAYASGTNAGFNFTPDDNGTYVVSLTVTDDDGGQGSDSKTIAVTNVAPTAAIVGAPSSSPEGTPINLTSTVSDPGSADTFTYAWSVTKNGNAYASGTSAGFSFTPDDNGSYVVSLTVTDDDGGVGSDSKTIAITNVDPTATINGAPALSPEGTQINLTSTVTDPGSADTFTYAWSVTKNGIAYASGTNAGFSFTPDDNGSYVVSLTVTDDDGGAGSDTKTIAITNVAPTATINGAPASSPEGSQINLTSTVTDPGSADTFTYAWSVTKNGNAYASGANAGISFTPDDNGSYVVNLSVTDDDGGIGSDSKTINVTNVAPTATINGAPASSPEGTAINLASTVNDPGSADTFTYAWSVTKNGNAYSSGTNSTFSFTPDDNGSYVVSLTVTDDDGGQGSDSKTITITNVAPTAAITGAPASSPEGTPIALGSTVTDPGSADTQSYVWSVSKNGNAFASGTNPSFNFTPDDNGSYVVTLKVTDDDGGIGTDSKTINVTNVAPTAAINGAPATSPEGTAINLTSTVTDPGSADTFTYTWSVTKNGNAYASGTNAGFNFTPNDNGTYVVSLTVTDDDGGVGSDSKTINVTNLAPTAAINVAPSSSLEGTAINLTSGVTDPGSADTFTFLWSVTKNGNAYASATTQNFSFTPDDNGSYVVSLKVTDDDGGIGTDSKSITVLNVAPTLSNVALTSAINENGTATLTGNISDPGSADTFSLVVNWGEGSPQTYNFAAGTTSFNVTHLYRDDNPTGSNLDNYSVNVTLSDDDGGTAPIASRNVAVSNVAPVLGAITGPSGSVIIGQTVTYTAPFSDVGTLDTHTLLINWGDGNTTAGAVAESNGSGTVSGSHTYAANGNFTVTFTLADDDGGTNVKTASLLTAQTIYVLNPTAQGSLSISGNATLSVNGNVVVDSNGSTALSATGNAQLTASSFLVLGGVQKTGNAVVNGPLTHGSMADPLASLVAPTPGTVLPAVSVSGNSSLTLNPGTYAQITVSGNGRLTLNPGIYIIAGGGFTVSGNGAVSGTGVAIVNTTGTGNTSGSFNVSGNGTFSLTPMTTGSLAGILIFQPAANTKAMSISGNATLGMRGTIYAPKSQVSVSGNGAISETIIADQLRLSGNAGSSMMVAGSDVSGSVVGAVMAGQLLSGVVWVSVDYGTTTMSADEQARFYNAVATLNNTFGMYGVTLVPVDTATSAEDIRIHITSDTPAGGADQGVLGFTTPGGDVYVVSGWDWYFGADGSAIGSQQYDYQTVLTHELGHGVGLDHSADSNSVMFATLSTGEARRNFTQADLANLEASAPDASDETEGHALMAGATSAKPPVRNLFDLAKSNRPHHHTGNKMNDVLVARATTSGTIPFTSWTQIAATWLTGDQGAEEVLHGESRV